MLNRFFRGAVAILKQASCLNGAKKNDNNQEILRSLSHEKQKEYEKACFDGHDSRDAFEQ
jgi:hypothetical protein